MTERTYKRFDLAHNQLEAAIALFITGGDRFSVITLAGAADVLLARLVLNTGQENFTDSVLSTEIKRGGTSVTREEFGKRLNNTLFINQLKHLDGGDSDVLELEPEECALAAILKALANYVKLAEHERKLVLAFRLWIKKNLDPKKYNVDCEPYWEPPHPKN